MPQIRPAQQERREAPQRELPPPQREVRPPQQLERPVPQIRPAQQERREAPQREVPPPQREVRPPQQLERPGPKPDTADKGRERLKEQIEKRVMPRDVREERRDDRKDVRDNRSDERKDVREDRREVRSDDRAERRFHRLDDLKQLRRQRVEGGRTLIEEPDKRVIVREQGRSFIQHDEGERFRRRFKDQRVERRQDGSTHTTYIRPDGVHVVSVVDSRGRLLHRYRKHRDGRTVVLIDNRRYHRPGLVEGLILGAFLDLRPPVIRIPREKYIVNYEEASYDDVYEALSAPPVDELDRGYSLDEIRYNHYLRERMRRIDLDSITFEFGAWEVAPDQYFKLERIGKAINQLLERNPDEIIMIEGHTDAVGSDEDNLTLSDRRAESVAMILSDEFGVPPENLVTQGYGEQFLKIETEAPERANRRVGVRRITPLMSRSGD